MLPIPLPSCTKSHDPFPLIGLHKRINPGPMQRYRLRNKTRFDSEELLAPRQNHNIEYHPFSAVGDCLFNIFADILHIGGRFSNRNLRKRHAVVTRTQLSRYEQAMRPTESPSHWISEAPSQNVRRRGRTFSHSPLCNTKVMNPWS
jgi:hypothetical protein